MRTEIRNNGIKDVTVVIADTGKVLRRVADGELIGEEVALGKVWYIGGVRQDPPRESVVSDFDEVDRPSDWGEPDQDIPDEGDDEPASDELSDRAALAIITRGL